MYDIQGALRRRALKERLEALGRADDAPSATADAAPEATLGSSPEVAAGPYLPAPPPAGPGLGQPYPRDPSAAPPAPPGDPNGSFPGRHRGDLLGERRRVEPTFPQSPPTAVRRTGPGAPEPLPGAGAMPGAGLPPSPYMTPTALTASGAYPAAAPPAGPPAAPASPTVSPYALLPDLPEPGPVDVPAGRVIDNTLRRGTPATGPAAAAQQHSGIPGATVAVTVVPGSPLSSRRVPGRSGAARIGDHTPTSGAIPGPATAAPPPLSAPVAPVAPVAEVRAASPDAESPADAATHTPGGGTVASAIADLLRQGGTSLFFRGDEPEE